MKRSLFFFLLLMVMLSLTNCKVKNYSSGAEPISHEKWDSLLQRHVSEEGWVDYPGFLSDSIAVNSYLELLSNNHPDPATWTDKERLAYWINAYNAFTVKLIMDHYPVESIKDIKSGIPFVNTVWDIKFIEIEGQTYDLNNIEHGILRPKFDEPRIHFAVNCASVSCPKLQNKAYTARQLDLQLDEAAREFINDPTRNIINENQLQLSKIFKWYGGDFDQGVRKIIEKYAGTEFKQNADIDYLEYNWRLNERKN